MSFEWKGQPYSVWVGKDRCVLRKKVKVAENRFEIADETDIRSWKSIPTDSGEVRVRSSPVRNALRPALRKLIQFAEDHGGTMLGVVLG